MVVKVVVVVAVGMVVVEGELVAEIMVVVEVKVVDAVMVVVEVMLLVVVEAEAVVLMATTTTTITMGEVVAIPPANSRTGSGTRQAHYLLTYQRECRRMMDSVAQSVAWPTVYVAPRTVSCAMRQDLL